MRALTLIYKPLSLELGKIIFRAFTSIGLPTAHKSFLTLHEIFSSSFHGPHLVQVASPMNRGRHGRKIHKIPGHSTVAIPQSNG
jgi:hypothetical protein